ncbi:IucA/IucC family protein [Halobacillus litoralis]|uniref:IucA/IucC family protein n=1 Tax=Halobacillus litoralis TaxID=45668 RepID=UPI001CD330CF|nr:IucA/IucC family siderophore biosynthesis protein [Halobacillus litoralis]MCA1022431.1 IucA/IucC family siderophore biosynthesis protein [Halobacillus litoralis]
MYKQAEISKTFNEADWRAVNRKLMAKMLAEYMYEDMIHPELTGEHGKTKTFELPASGGKVYTFKAVSRLFDSWDVEAASITVKQDGAVEEPADAVQLLIDLKDVIGMKPETTGHLIKELQATLIADVHLKKKTDRTSRDLIDLDYAELEGYMDGHPWITYNKGRIGFGFDDYLRYAPEHQEEILLSWIAVHHSLAEFQAVEGLSCRDLLEKELSQEERERFAAVVKEEGKDPDDYYFLPMHEWQWKNTVVLHFPGELAQKTIIPLGDGQDKYLPQQSIRTFVNRSEKDKHHVKLPMSILNTLVYRGLPAERTRIAPKVTALIKGMYEKDDFLKRECRVILPGENASINVDQPHFTSVKNAPYQYLEMLGTIWRESIYTYVEEGEQPITLAALLHKDYRGTPYVQELIEASGMEPEAWMRQFYKVVMDPLLHFLYQYGTVFSPHGQNTILVLKDYRPHRLAVKDFVDDVNVTDQPFEELKDLSQEMKDVLRSEPPEGLTQFIFTGLFICHLRYLSDVLETHELMEEEVFWGLLAEAIQDYQMRFPQLRERFELFDFFKPTMTKLCLNRNRMVDYGYEDGEDRPHASEYGQVTNALAAFKNNVEQTT